MEKYENHMHIGMAILGAVGVTWFALHIPIWIIVFA